MRHICQRHFVTKSKVTAEHLKRSAYVYVRQSAMRQVVENAVDRAGFQLLVNVGVSTTVSQKGDRMSYPIFIA